MLYLSLFWFVIALLSFLSVPALGFLLSSDKAALCHAVPFVLSSPPELEKVGPSHS